jgi:hypothetical protein
MKIQIKVEKRVKNSVRLPPMLKNLWLFSANETAPISQLSIKVWLVRTPVADAFLLILQ